MKELAKLLQPGVLQLDDISPALSLLFSSSISIPGSNSQVFAVLYSAALMNCFQEEVVYIHSFDKNVALLSSKTKPKKIVISGSDGHRYPFLLKGCEDLVWVICYFLVLRSVAFG